MIKRIAFLLLLGLVLVVSVASPRVAVADQPSPDNPCGGFYWCGMWCVAPPTNLCTWVPRDGWICNCDWGGSWCWYEYAPECCDFSARVF